MDKKKPVAASISIERNSISNVGIKKISSTDSSKLVIENLTTENLPAISQVLQQNFDNFRAQSAQTNQHSFKTKVVAVAMGLTIGILNPMVLPNQSVEQQLAATQAQVAELQIKVDKQQSLIDSELKLKNPSTLANNSKLKELLEIDSNGLFVVMEAELYGVGKFSLKAESTQNVANYSSTQVASMNTQTTQAPPAEAPHTPAMSRIDFKNLAEIAKLSTETQPSAKSLIDAFNLGSTQHHEIKNDDACTIPPEKLRQMSTEEMKDFSESLLNSINRIS